MIRVFFSSGRFIGRTSLHSKSFTSCRQLRREMPLSLGRTSHTWDCDGLSTDDMKQETGRRFLQSGGLSSLLCMLVCKRAVPFAPPRWLKLHLEGLDGPTEYFENRFWNSLESRRATLCER